MIRRVFIRGYKSLRDIDISLKPLTVIVGPNASGKSNLLDALGLLSGIVTSPTISAAFDKHRGLPLEAFFIPGGGLEESLRKETLRFTLGADVELSPDAVAHTEKTINDMRAGLPSDGAARRGTVKRVRETYLRYRVDVEFYTPTGQIRVANERLLALKPDGEPNSRRKPFLEPDSENDRLILRMEGQARPSYHDVGLDRALVSTSLYPPHYPHITAFKEELRRWRFYCFDPGVMRQETPLKVVDSLGADGRDLAGFYHTLKTQSPQQFQGISDSLPFAVPSAESIETELTTQGFISLIYKDGGIRYSARVISDGTLRALGLFAILSPFNKASTIGFEEPENGVHPRRLSVIARLLENAARRDSNTQIIATTHSPRLPEILMQDCLSSPERVLIAACLKRDNATTFEDIFDSPMFMRGETKSDLEDADEDDEATLEEILIRGDFGG